MKRPLIADHRTGTVVGLALLGAGFFVLYDAFDGHGRPKPWFLGSILPW